MDAFDQGIVNCQNFAKARAIVSARMDSRKRKASQSGAPDYTVATLTSDIASATQAKESYVREAQGREARLFSLLDGISSLWQDTVLVELLQEEGLSQRPELAGNYNVATST
jgi:hypothetical protein